jgi:hypothetical protein
MLCAEQGPVILAGSPDELLVSCQLYKYGYARYRIPVGTLRDWEQGRKEPDAAAKAYLHVIATDPEMVRKALARRRGP